MTNEKKIAGINGFGRFGLHLIKYWLDRSEKSSFIIKYINDDFLSLDQSIKILKNNKKVLFNKYKILKFENKIKFLKPDGVIYEVEYSNKKKAIFLGLENQIYFLKVLERIH